jgi:hypothetical protein
LWKRHLKINTRRNPLNFKSIQWNYLQAFPISWEYLFNIIMIASSGSGYEANCYSCFVYLT